MTTNPQQVTVVDLSAVTHDLNMQESSINVVSSFSGLRSRSINNLLVILNVAQIQETGDYFSRHEALEQTLRAVLLNDAGAHLSMLPQLLAPFRHKRLFKLLLPASGPEIMQRILFAWGIKAQDTLIADAQVLGDRLVVLSCSLEKIEVPFDASCALKAVPPKERGHFRINEQGSYIHWPAGDIHLDLDALRYAANPVAADKIKAKGIKYDREYGQGIADVRKEKGLKQSDISGLTNRHVRRIEAGEIRPTAKALRHLAQAHGVTLADYLNIVAHKISA